MVPINVSGSISIVIKQKVFNNDHSKTCAFEIFTTSSATWDIKSKPHI